MYLGQIAIPPGINRISAAEFRQLVAGQGNVNQIAQTPQKTGRAVSPDPDEHTEQAAFVHWLRSEGIRHNATPNGGKRALKTAKYLKAEGVSPGFPDLTIWPEHGTGRPILYIEMKRGRGGRTTPEQLDWLSYLEGFAEVRTEICHGAIQAINFVKKEWEM